MLREVRDLGFEDIELGHGTRISLAEGILKVVEAGEVRICSLHNFCPLPPGVFDAAPNLYLLSARKDLEWDNAIRHTRNTIKFANRLGAPIVVLHAGSVTMGRWTKKLLDLSQPGQSEPAKYQTQLRKALAERARHQARYFAQTVKAFHSLVSYAAENRVKLAIETRYALEEIPDENEVDELLRLFPGETVGYWHDVGHAQVRENLGIGRSTGWLERFSSRLMGFHVHDTVPPGKDHHPPGEGVVDFSKLAPYLAKDVPCVLELDPSVPKSRVRMSVEYLRRLIPTKRSST